MNAPSRGLWIGALLVVGFGGVSPTSADEPCTLPGLTVAIDPAADGVPDDPQLDVRSVHVLEPYVASGPDLLYFTLKVGHLEPGNLPLNAFWRVSWIDPLVGNRWFVRMANCPGGVQYDYGVFATNGYAVLGAAHSGTYAADGSVTIAIERELVNFPRPGDQLTGIDGDTRLIVGPCPEGQAPAAYPLVDDTANGEGSRTYTVTGNAACAPTSLRRSSWGRIKAGYAR